MIKTKNPLFRRMSRLNELQVVDMALSELEQNIHLPRERTAAFLRCLGAAMNKKLSQIRKTTVSDELCELVRRSFLFGSRDGFASVGDMLIALHQIRPTVEQRVVSAARCKLAASAAKTGAPRRPFCERIWRPLTITVSIACAAALLFGGGVILHYLYPNGMFLRSVEVPDLVGQNLNTAQPDRRLFAPQVTYRYDAQSAVGTILAQSPQAGMIRRVSPGRHPCRLALTVSLGAEQVQVGDYVGMTKYQALTACRRLGVIPDIQTVDGYPAGNVARTEPAAGAVVSAGDTVTLYVGTSHRVAQVAVPNLVGLSEVTAGTMLTSLGLQRGNVTYMHADEPIGTVIAQTVLSGNSVGVGTRVGIVVSKGAAGER